MRPIKRSLRLLSIALTRFWLFALFCSCATLPLKAISQESPDSNDNAQVKAHLKEILSQKEFQTDTEKNPFEQGFHWVQEQWNKISKWFQDTWDWITKQFGKTGQSFGSLAQVLVYVVMAALVIALVMFLVGQFYQYRSGERRALKRTVFDGREEDEDSFSQDPDAWVGVAKTQEENGDFRKAYRAIFIAILLHLDLSGMIKFEKSSTNGDYLRQLRNASRTSLVSILQPLVIEFDRRWYGGRETNRAEYQEILATLEKVKEQILKEPIVLSQDANSAGTYGEAF